MVSGGLAPRSGLSFSHPMLVGIGVLVLSFISYPMPLGIRELVHCWGRGFMDHGGYQDSSRSLGIRLCQPHVFFLEFVEFRECPVVVS